MSEAVRMYFNPACSKCREALSLLDARGITPTLIEYLRVPLTTSELVDVIAKTGEPPLHIVRTKDAAFQTSGLTPESSAEDVARAVVAAPTLLERPIVVRGAHALVARPPERLLALFAG